MTKQEYFDLYSDEDGFVSLDDNMGEHESECKGWDGISKRCDCGGLRICWDFVLEQPWIC